MRPRRPPSRPAPSAIARREVARARARAKPAKRACEPGRRPAVGDGRRAGRGHEGDVRLRARRRRGAGRRARVGEARADVHPERAVDDVHRRRGRVPRPVARGPASASTSAHRASAWSAEQHGCARPAQAPSASTAPGAARRSQSARLETSRTASDGRRRCRRTSGTSSASAASHHGRARLTSPAACVHARERAEVAEHEAAIDAARQPRRRRARRHPPPPAAAGRAADRLAAVAARRRRGRSVDDACSLAAPFAPVTAS